MLLCTTIIESGLDIPNANTIIIDRADTFGLAQLYQLRGRVGRRRNRAYAYLFCCHSTRPDRGCARAVWTPSPKHTELGAGFSHRHARPGDPRRGRPAGARQNGHIAAVGFDLYTQLLAQAVNEARENVTKDEGRRTKDDRSDEIGRSSSVVRHSLEDPLAPTVQLNLDLPPRIPESYVPEAALRLQLYRRLAGLTTLDAVDELAQEFADRFGPVPKEVRNLLLRRADQSAGDQCRCGSDRVRGRAVADQMCALGDAGSELVARSAEEPGYIGARHAAGHLAGDT